MLFVIGSSSELLGLSSSLELWFCVLFRSFWVVLVNFPVGRFTRTIISVSPVHVSAVSVDNPSLPVLPSTFCPLFVDGMQKEALLFLLQRLGGVGAGGAEGLPEDGQEGDRE